MTLKVKLYTNNKNFVSGMTLKDLSAPENNNMALHACENTEIILSNRKKLAEFLDVSLGDFICTQQTHSANFRRVTKQHKGSGAYTVETAMSDTDGLYTFDTGVLLCSFAADCAPVIIRDKKTGLIGVIHSGWQGTVKEITLKLLKHIISVEQCNPTDLEIQIGASISQQQFEVDRDVYLKFEDLGYASEFMYFNSSTNKYHIDNQATVKRQCELAGIPSSQIRIDSTCTFLNSDGFSYRQDRKCGRHLIFAMTKNQ